jgi:hypothetical protein
MFQKSPLEALLLFEAKAAKLNVTAHEAGAVQTKSRSTLPVVVVFPVPV